MRKNLLMALLQLLAVSIAFSIFVPAAQTWTVGGFAVHQEDEWKAKYDKLRADYETLLTAVFDLLAEVEKLKSNYKTLVTEFEKLRSEYEKLRSDYNELNAGYISLSSDYESAIRQLNTTRTWMYFFGITTIVFIATTAYLLIRKRKAKPEAVPEAKP